MARTDPGMAYQDITTLPAGLRVLSCGMTVDQDQHPDRMLPCWVLGLITAGRMPIRIGTHEAVVARGGYYLLPPQVRHSGMARSRFTVAWWHLEGTSPGTIALPWTGMVPDDVQPLPLLRTCQRMRARGDDPQWVGLQIEALLARVASHQGGHPTSMDQVLAEELLDWLLQHRHQAWDRVALERRFRRTYRTLNRTFRARFGTGLHTRHLDLRIDFAKELLIGGATLAEAGERTGFRDYFTFLRRFRAIAGMTAGQWQRQGG